MRPLEHRLYLNENWGFKERFVKEMCRKGYDWKKLEKVTLPHSVLYGFPAAREKSSRMACGYRKEFSVGKAWQEGHIFLTIERPLHQMTVYLNGEEAAKARMGEDRLRLEITDFLTFRETNIVVIRIDNREDSCSIFGGLCSDVYLEVKNEVFVQEVSLTPGNLNWEEKTLTAEVVLNKAEKGLTLRQKFSLPGERGRVICTGVPAEKKTVIQSEGLWADVWDTDQPVCYELVTELLRGEELLDIRKDRLAFCAKEWRQDGFYLNGERHRLLTVKRPAVYPYVGYAMTDRLQRSDADYILELGCTAVMPEGPAFTEDFINYCDEKGLLVLTRETAYAGHPSVVTVTKEQKEKAERMAEQAYQEFGTAETGLLNRCYENSREIGLIPLPLTHSYPLTAAPGQWKKGLLDLFRNRRKGTELYVSQREKETIQPALNWEETSDGVQEPVCYTNGEEAEWYTDRILLGQSRPDRKRYSRLPHPPVTVEGFAARMAGVYDKLGGKTVGELLRIAQAAGQEKAGMVDKVKLSLMTRKAKLSREELDRLEAMYRKDWEHSGTELLCRVKDGEGCVRESRLGQQEFAGVKVWSETVTLKETHTYDVTCIHLQAEDRDGRAMWDYSGTVNVETIGLIRLIGPEKVRLYRGCGGIYIRTAGQPGEGEVRISWFGCSQPHVIHFTIEA